MDENIWSFHRRWEDNMKMNLMEVGYEYVECIHLTQDGNL
jgi:hypothetical protein